MATSIFFGGRRLVIPGAYSQYDTSGLATSSPAAVGIVALIGTAEGGKPLSVASEDSDHTQSSTLLSRYRPGSPLRTAGIFAFQPSNDDAVPGGAQRLVCVKVNPAVQSTATLDDANGDDSVVLTSRDYGLFTTQINVEVDTGTNLGKQITVTFEETVETFDDVGGTPILDLLYTPGSSGYGTATAQFGTADFRGVGTRVSTGLDAQRAADIGTPGTLTYVSSSAGDTTQTVTAYGLDNSNNPVSETRTLNGTTPVAGAATFATVLGVIMSATAAGTVVVRDGASTTLFSLSTGQTTRGVIAMTNAPIVPASSTLAIDTGASGADALVVTQSAAGQALMQRIDLSSATPVALTGAGTRLLYLIYGDVPAARTVTLTARMFTLAFSTFNTVQRAVDALNVLPGLTANAQVSNPTTFLMADADRATAANILSSTANFYADTFAFIDTLNQNSAFIRATRATSPLGSLVPANTTSPVYLTGGSEGVTTITEWQQAFALLKNRRVNTIVPLSRDPAVHALLRSHLRDRAGTLRSEANGYIGLAQSSGAGETLSNTKSQIRSIQTRHISAISQEAQCFSPDTGEATWYPPYYFAAIAAGMQAGSPIGEPLTFKRPNVLAIRNDSSWTVADNKEELIDAGLMLAENVDNVGVRWIRSITTHIADDNPIFTEMSANESADQFAFQFRTALERRIGSRALGSTIGALKGLANDVAQRMVDDQVIVAYRALQIEQIGDTFPISIEIAPIQPVNFIPITIHLVVARAAA